MRYMKTDISTIQYQYKEYSKSLYDSILRIGFSFPISVRQSENGYQCLDGHKRLSVLHDILEKDPHYRRGREVYIFFQFT